MICDVDKLLMNTPPREQSSPLASKLAPVSSVDQHEMTAQTQLQSATVAQPNTMTETVNISNPSTAVMLAQYRNPSLQGAELTQAALAARCQGVDLVNVTAGFKVPSQFCHKLAISPIVAKSNSSFSNVVARDFRQLHTDRHSVATDAKPLFTASSPSNRYQSARDRFSTASSTTSQSGHDDVSLDSDDGPDTAMDCASPASDVIASPLPGSGKPQSPSLAKTPRHAPNTAALKASAEAIHTTPIGSTIGNRTPLRRMLSKERLSNKLVAKDLRLSPMVGSDGIKMSPQIARLKGIKSSVGGESTPQRRLVKKVFNPTSTKYTYIHNVHVHV